MHPRERRDKKCTIFFCLIVIKKTYFLKINTYVGKVAEEKCKGEHVLVRLGHGSHGGEGCECEVENQELEKKTGELLNVDQKMCACVCVC